MKRLLLPLTILVLILAACSSDGASTDTTDDTVPDTQDTTSPPLDASEVVFIWSETGGCAMAGPNCARYEITAGGDISTYREGDKVVANTGKIDPKRVQEFVDIAAAVDVAALTDRVGAGEMTAAFDGVDFVLEAPSVGLNLSSVDVDFANSEALFSNAKDLALLAAETATLELTSR